MSISGALIGVDLPEALQMLGRAQSSGILSVNSESGTARVLFDRGGVVYATSDNVGPIGESFIQKGLLSQDQLEDVLRMQRRKKVKQPIGTILTELGLIEKEAAADEVEAHTVRVLQPVLDWMDAKYTFEPIEGQTAGILKPSCMQVDNLLLRLVV